MPPSPRRAPLLIGFFIISLLLHLLVISLLPERSLFAPRTPPEPVVVEVRPPKPPPRERELDAPAVPDEPRETPAKRLGPSDSVAPREQAPQGEAPDDLPAPAAPAPAPAPPRPEVARKPAPRPLPTPAPPKEAPPPRREAPARDEGAPPPSPPAPDPAPTTKPPAEPFPDLKTLTTLPQATVARLENEWRRKYRADVERGDAYFLDMERDILISFFQRFRNNVYGVWNYPARSRDRGEEGTCLLRVTINRDGTVAEVRLMEGSGYPALDEEAMAAVRKGASYGPLPRAYEGETLTIFAFFNYSLTRTRIY